MELKNITLEAEKTVRALLEAAHMKKGQILVVGCSTSEVHGSRIGSESSEEIAAAIMAGILPVVKEQGLYLACQCCEHLNRCLVVERECADRYNLPEVTVKPALHAGGAWACQAVKDFDDYCMVESITAHAAIDIGDTFVGMHLRSVVVPVRSADAKIGDAHITMARTRPKYVGGPRAQYPEGAGR